MVVELKVEPQSQGTPLVEPGQTSVDKKVTPKMIPEADYLKAVSDEKTVSGRLKTQLEVVTKERDTFKKQVEEATAASEETKATIADLETDLEALGEGNLDAAEVITLKKKLREEIRAEKAKLAQEVKTEKDALAELKKTATAEREQWANTVSEAQAMKFEADVFEVAEEYEGGNPERLKLLAEKAGKTKHEDIQGLADVLWTKKAKPEGSEPAIIEDSGVTSGGGVDLSKLSGRELLILGQKKKK